jgi:hypothetical protein
MEANVRPEKVTAPRGSWHLIDVLWSGPETGTNWSMAMGRWDGRPVLAQRWDGDNDEAKGMPISTGHAVWFVVPDETYPLLVDSDFVPLAKRSFVKAILGLDNPGATAA